jgi:hypothetical protein
MKTIVALVVTLCFVVAPMTTFAGKGGQGSSKGPNQQAYKKADENAQFKREGEAVGSEDTTKLKKRKRVEETKGEDMGKGNKNRHKNRVGQEGSPAD